MTTGPGVGVLLLGRWPGPLFMPRSVAILYFLILALEIRLVKWNTDTWSLKPGAMAAVDEFESQSEAVRYSF